MPLTLSLRELVRAWDARLRGDAAFATLVGTDAAGTVRLGQGFPKTPIPTPAAPDFRRVTYFRPATNRRTRDPEHVILQSDIWAWPDDATGGQQYIDDIDERMLELLAPEEGAATWFDAAAGIWVSCGALESSDPQGEWIRRMRRWRVAPA